jgi:hypothetical protein
MLEPPTLSTRFVRVFQFIRRGAEAPMVDRRPRCDGPDTACASKAFHWPPITKIPDAAPFGHAGMCGAQTARRYS